MLWTAALAVPEMLCDNGLVALICMTVTIPMENPKIPATIMAPQKRGESISLVMAENMVCASK